MNQNYNYGNVNNSYGAATPVAPIAPSQPKDSKQIIFYILLAVAAVGCFLPYLTISGFGESVSMNYVYAEGKMLDGVYIIGLMIAAFSSSLKKGFKPAIILLGIALGVVVFDIIDIQSEMDTLTYGGLLDVKYGIGFYLSTIGVAGAFILSIMLNKNAPVVAGSNVTVTTNVNPQPMAQPVQATPGQPNYVQPNYGQQTMTNQFVNPQPMTQPVPQTTVAPVQTNCPYCGAARNEGMFCKTCGGKY